MSKIIMVLLIWVDIVHFSLQNGMSEIDPSVLNPVLANIAELAIESLHFADNIFEDKFIWQHLIIVAYMGIVFAKVF